jgi:hypothetical protein
MKLSLLANMCDQATGKIADTLHHPFKAIGAALSRDYGGSIKHLWIDFELIRSHCELRPPRAFRLQKKVGGGCCHLTGLQTSVSENVGHYSVRPDFDILLSLPLDAVVSYALSLIYDSTVVLIAKQKKLGGFDATAFRSDFRAFCASAGYKLSINEDNANKPCVATGDNVSRGSGA